MRHGAALRPRQSESRKDHGAYLTRHESKSSYAIIRHNVRTYISGGVVEIVRGQDNAALAMRRLEEQQASDDRHEGWRYFLEETELTPGMDPRQATQQRWTEFEAREARAMNAPNPEFPRR